MSVPGWYLLWSQYCASFQSNHQSEDIDHLPHNQDTRFFYGHIYRIRYHVDLVESASVLHKDRRIFVL